MMSWFRRGDDPASPPPPDPDSPHALGYSLDALVRRINASSGRLPVDALVGALDVADLVRALLDTTLDSDDVPDVQVILSVRGIVHDYLPTTLDRYMALDPSTADRVLPSGVTPRSQVIDQLTALATAAADVLEATRARDADHLVTQGNFLRTKFSRSDLDL